MPRIKNQDVLQDSGKCEGCFLLSWGWCIKNTKGTFWVEHSQHMKQHDENQTNNETMKTHDENHVKDTDTLWKMMKPMSKRMNTWWTWWKYIDQQMSNFFCGSPFLRQIWRQEPSPWEGLWPPFAMRSGVACARKETSMRQQVGIFWQTDANMRYDMSRAQKALLAESYLGLFTRITYTLYKYWFCYKITH